jgi:hypothetical protein
LPLTISILLFTLHFPLSPSTLVIKIKHRDYSRLRATTDAYAHRHTPGRRPSFVGLCFGL